MIRKEECYRKCVNITPSSIKDDQDTVVIGFKITSKDKTCAPLIYNGISDYYNKATKRVRLVCTHLQLMYIIASSQCLLIRQLDTLAIDPVSQYILQPGYSVAVSAYPSRGLTLF